jgi:hypothetical protein
MGNFLDTDRARDKVVMDMVEDASLGLLIVGISEGKAKPAGSCEVNVYEIGASKADFKFIQTITL